MAILLLNASYEPLGVITKRRALSLLLRQRVDGVSEEMASLIGVVEALSIPAVLKLRRYVNVPRKGTRWSRRGVMLRDNYTCIYCGIRAGQPLKKRLLNRADFTIDHILPQSRGGRNSWGNTACACAACNGRKGDRTPKEARLKLLWQPQVPRVDYQFAASNTPESWKFYLDT